MRFLQRILFSLVFLSCAGKAPLSESETPPELVRKGALGADVLMLENAEALGELLKTRGSMAGAGDFQALFSKIATIPVSISVESSVGDCAISDQDLRGLESEGVLRLKMGRCFNLFIENHSPESLSGNLLIFESGEVFAGEAMELAPNGFLKLPWKSTAPEGETLFVFAPSGKKQREIIEGMSINSAFLNLGREYLRARHSASFLKGEKSNSLLMDVRGELRALKGKQAVIRYGLGESNLQVMLSFDDQQTMVEVPVSAEQLSAAIHALRRSIGVGPGTLRAAAPRLRGVKLKRAKSTPPLDFSAAGKRISDILFPTKIRRALKGASGLTVVPSAGLASVPFAALPVFEDRPLILDMALSYAPGHLGLSSSSSGSVKYHKPLLIGDPSIPATDQWFFPRLSGAKKELEFAGELLGVRPFLDSAATRSVFLEQANGADLIFVATHGISDPKNPLRGSFLAMGDQFQYQLNALDIMGLNLNKTRLVVLSACQTGLGFKHDGGIIGLARAFQVAGAANTMMSLWSIPDQPTRILMESFLKHHVQLRKSEAEALQAAMIELYDKNHPPRSWAGFSIFGVGH